MNVDVFLQLLTVISTLTGLVTEAWKKQCPESNGSKNLLAGTAALAVGTVVCVVYHTFFQVDLTLQTIISYFILTLFSWLVSMLGYDKVVQALEQLGVKRHE